MRAVFTHFNRFNFIYEKNSLAKFLLVFSGYSWKKQYPNDTVVLYCDQETANWVNSLNNLAAWDEINVESKSYKEIEKELNISEQFWAWPKIYTAFQEKEACCIVDIDVIVFSDFKSTFDLKRPWATRYKTLDLDSKKICSYPDLRLITCSSYYNGGLIYHPAVDSLHEISKIILDSCYLPGAVKAIEDFGYSKYLIAVEQSVPCWYYEQKCNQKPELFDQLCDLDFVLKTPGTVYHAMGEKYGKSNKEKIKIVSKILTRLGFTKKSQMEVLMSLGFNESCINLLCVI